MPLTDMRNTRRGPGLEWNGGWQLQALFGRVSTEYLMYKLGCKQQRDGTQSPQDRMRSLGEKLKIEPGDRPVLIGSEEEEEPAES